MLLKVRGKKHLYHPFLLGYEQDLVTKGLPVLSRIRLVIVHTDNDDVHAKSHGKRLSEQGF